MPHFTQYAIRRHLRSLAAQVIAGAGLVLMAALPAAAQHGKSGNSVTVKDGADSLSYLVPRQSPGSYQASLRTEDRKVALLLQDTVIVLQLTDRGMEQLFEADTARRSVGGAIFARMVKAGVSGLLDHGIAYRLSALRRAYSDGTRLVLEDRDGKHVFESTEYNGHHPMQEFTPREAERFADAVQRAIVARR
jgi:hypothetical protein